MSQYTDHIDLSHMSHDEAITTIRELPIAKELRNPKIEYFFAHSGRMTGKSILVGNDIIKLMVDDILLPLKRDGKPILVDQSNEEVTWDADKDHFVDSLGFHVRDDHIKERQFEPWMTAVFRRHYGEIKDTIFREICEAIEIQGLEDWFKIKGNSITCINDNELKLMGTWLSNQKGSTSGLKRLRVAVLEEAAHMNLYEMERILGTMDRNVGTRLYAMWNRRYPNDGIEIIMNQMKKLNSNKLIEWVSDWLDNPFLSNKAYEKIAEKELTWPKARFDHHYRGAWLTDSNGLVWKEGEQWIKGDRDARVKELGIKPRYGLDLGYKGSPTVLVEAYHIPEDREIYISNVRHFFGGMAPRHYPAWIAGINKLEPHKWDWPTADNEKDREDLKRMLYPMMDYREISDFKIWMDTDHAIETELQKAGFKAQCVVKGKKDFIKSGVNHIENQGMLVINDKHINNDPTLPLRCEQAFYDLPRWFHKLMPNSDTEYDKEKFEDTDDHFPDALRYAFQDAIFAEDKPLRYQSYDDDLESILEDMGV